MRSKLLVGVSLLMLIEWSPQSMAQTAVNTSDQSTGGLEDIVVTAQRVKQNLEDVPIAVTNFTPAEMEQAQINGTEDIPRMIPNMFTNNNVGTGSGNVYYLRGLGQTESFPTFDPQVGTYVDDIYIGRVSAANFGLFDVDQIQVLRGPQGTLFGRNSTGGAIVLSMAKPEDNFGGYAEAGYGEYNRFFGKASINLPVTDYFLTKTSVYGVRDDGYVDDVVTGQKLNGHDDWGVRESVHVVPPSMTNITWDASADYSRSGYNAVQNYPFDGKRISYSGEGNINAAIPVSTFGVPILADIQKIIQRPIGDLANGEDLQTWGAMSNIEAQFDAGTLNFITGYRGQNQVGAADFPFPAVSGNQVPYDNNYLGQFGIFLNSSVNQYSQEVKWTGKLGEKISYTAGLFYLYEENTSQFVETLTVPGGPASVIGLELNAPQVFHNTTDSKAAYGQADYKWDDHLTVTVGARFTEEHKTYGVYSPSAAGYDTADVQAAGNRTKLKTDQLTPRVSLQYRFDPELMAYASATRGFQGGGWNSLTGAAETVTAFDPETVWTYETGVRYQTADRKLRINADFFYNDISNYQLVTLGPGSGNFVTENAADLTTYGVEADVSYKPIDALTLTGTIGLENGYYTGLSAVTQTQKTACQQGLAGIAGGATGDCGQGIINLIGGVAQPEDFPPVTATLAALYDLKFAKYDVLPSAGLQFMAANHVDTSGVPDGLTPDHILLDLGVTVRLHDYPLSITAECQNCADTSYETSLLFVKYYNNPGIWDIKARYDF